MESIHGHSAACCNIPPIISKGYKEIGKYETIGSLKTYVTGRPEATKALLVMYDIWGYFPQTLQGADILATSDQHDSYQVFMPDFFEGEPCNKAWYPPVTDEQKEKFFSWYSLRTPLIGAARVPQIIADIEAAYGKKTWGAVGFCWGGNVVSLISGPDTLFKASAQAHPGMLNVADAEKITIPTCMLASKGEAADIVEAWGEALTVRKNVRRFGEQVHGWMSAKGDLEDEKCREDYESGYKIFLEWFAKYL